MAPHGTEVHIRAVSEAAAHGITYRTEDRREPGLLVEKSLRENLTLPILRTIGGAGMKEIVKRIMHKGPQVPVDAAYLPALISATIEITALCFVSDTPSYGRFIIVTTLVMLENAESSCFPDSPF